MCIKLAVCLKKNVFKYVYVNAFDHFISNKLLEKINYMLTKEKHNRLPLHDIAIPCKSRYLINNQLIEKISNVYFSCNS